jgi:hypothetical protein
MANRSDKSYNLAKLPIKQMRTPTMRFTLLELYTDRAIVKIFVFYYKTQSTRSDGVQLLPTFGTSGPKVGFPRTEKSGRTRLIVLPSDGTESSI